MNVIKIEMALNFENYWRGLDVRLCNRMDERLSAATGSKRPPTLSWELLANFQPLRSAIVQFSP